MDLRSIVSMVLIFFLRFNGVAGGALQYNFYEESCPQLEDIVSTGLHPIFLTDPTSAPALLRLLFHDCQVQVSLSLSLSLSLMHAAHAQIDDRHLVFER